MTPEERIAQLEAEVRSLRLVNEGLAVAVRAANLRLQQEGDAMQALMGRREAARLKKQRQRALKGMGVGDGRAADVSRDTGADMSPGQTRDIAGTPPLPPSSSSFPSSFPPSSEPPSSYPLSFPPSSPTPSTTSSAAADRERPEDLQALWNREAHASLPRWKDLTQKRRTVAAARLAERPLAEWSEVIRRISASPFCLGENDRGWKAGPEFLLRPNTATRALEGEFNGTPKTGRGPAPPSDFETPFVAPKFKWLEDQT